MLKDSRYNCSYHKHQIIRFVWIFMWKFKYVASYNESSANISCNISTPLNMVASSWDSCNYSRLQFTFFNSKMIQLFNELYNFIDCGHWKRTFPVFLSNSVYWIFWEYFFFTLIIHQHNNLHKFYMKCIKRRKLKKNM